uniref:Protein kinase domain-containing protein n=1 Tax=Macrostomum lignano TaxID=282301 RepID=A0A1I8IKV7_9PLAT
MPIFSSSVRPKCDLTVTRYKNFSVQICQDRLATIQSLVRNDETLLVVCGIDSHFSQGSQQLFDYLLFNVNQKRAAEIERTKLEDEHFDDVVLSIRRNRVQVYLNPANYWFYLPYVACWPNLDIHCAPDALFDDQDAMEELKMKFLIQAVDGCNSVCVAYYGKDHLAESAGFSPMLVEKWPLIQAYAVDGFGVGTFFTLKHQLRDVSKDVFGLIQSVDAVAVEDLTDKPLKPFKNQFDSVFQTIDFLAGRSEPQLVLEEKSLNQLIEPFRSYARHEMTGKSELSAGAGQHPSLRSYLAFDTRRSAIDLLAKTASTEPAAINRPFAPLAANFIVQSEDRIHSLVCARTGFLHWNLPEAAEHDCQSVGLHLLLTLMNSWTRRNRLKQLVLLPVAWLQHRSWQTSTDSTGTGMSTEARSRKHWYSTAYSGLRPSVELRIRNTVAFVRELTASTDSCTSLIHSWGREATRHGEPGLQAAAVGLASHPLHGQPALRAEHQQSPRVGAAQPVVKAGADGHQPRAKVSVYPGACIAAANPVRPADMSASEASWQSTPPRQDLAKQAALNTENTKPNVSTDGRV